MRVRVRFAVLALLAAGLVAGCGPLRRFAYAGPGRDGWQQPDRVVTSLGLEPGARVADLGAGGGYFTWRLADAVGPQGQVFAVDVDDEMLAHLAEQSRERGDANVETVLGEYDDPLIPEGGVDWIFTCNTYHHIEERSAYFANARRYLRPGGRVAIVEFNGQGWFERWFVHYVPADEVRAEMRAAGYVELASHDYLDRQSFLVFGLAD